MSKDYPKSLGEALRMLKAIRERLKARRLKQLKEARL